MAGFVNTAEYAQAREDGQTWVTQFRKLVASAASVTNAWVDYTYSGGSPSANFYASTPLNRRGGNGARVLCTDGCAGNSIPEEPHGDDRFILRDLDGERRQQLILCDYLLYYPFIDTDAVGEDRRLRPR
ncbi:MAG: hypothetical protein IPI85_17825 [Dehalococcoidia bacterium]|nr:hypothetical protein [Dehalococcoidia bacterium]